MTEIRRQNNDGAGPDLSRITHQAVALSDRLPDLVLRARQLSTTISHGWHGRKRAGTGTEFWQYRNYSFGESRRRIDWRRTARDNNAVVREREWEAAHTVWLWCDLRPSMHFKSDLASETKIERALLITLTLAEILTASGERVGLLGSPLIGHQTRPAERLAHSLRERGFAPQDPTPTAQVKRFSDVVLISDFLEPIETFEEMIAPLVQKGMYLSALQVLDPSEETFPFTGRVLFTAPDGDDQHDVQRAELIRATYHARLAAHRSALRTALTRRGQALFTHHTDTPVAGCIRTLADKLEQGGGML